MAIGLFAVSLLMIAHEAAAVQTKCALSMIEEHGRFSLACGVSEWGRKLLVVAPALSLTWALFEVQAYLKRIEDGAVWAPSTMKLLGRIGECLITTAVLSSVVLPTVSLWINDGHGGFDWHLEAETLALGGLGIALEVIARVLGDVLQAAATIKADHDEIV